ncbi:MAG: TonB-dependent receptor, partial [Flavisolibacter sp.]|nr:TonB-dependent receptor [Flavisolibacter sp.]
MFLPFTTMLLPLIHVLTIFNQHTKGLRISSYSNAPFMKRVLLLALFAFFIGSTALLAQKVTGTVRGILQDSITAQPLTDATVSVMKAKDSSLISFTLSSNSGFFEIKNLATGTYYIIVSYQGFKTIKKPFTISTGNAITDLRIIKMERAYKKMQEVVIVDDAPVKIKGDTLAFNANSFKTKPNATVEDLLKKLPGVQVDRDGTVKAQGENVQKVYVDGKEFFSNDPKLATKNLTADMVDQVELFDDMSEQAKFNRIDDGSRTKAINLKLKKDKKKGVFGKAYAGYGTSERYDAGVTANFFKGATQTSVIAKANNTNNIGFTVSDMMGMFSSGMGGFSGGMSGFGGSGGGGGTVMLGGGRGLGATGLGGFSSGFGNSGITKTSSAGINYRDTWSKHFDVNGSYFFNHANTDNLRNAFRQTFFLDSTINSNQRQFSQNTNNNHRINFNLIYSIDSLNSIIYNPNINLQNSEQFSDDSSSLFAVKNGASYKINDTRTVNDNTGEGINWANNLIWRRKFSKIGRTLSVNFSNTFSRNNREGIVRSTSSIYNESGANVRDNNFNQQSLTDNRTNNYGVTISYTEPITRNKIVEVNYSYNNNQNASDRRTFNFNAGNGKYDVENPLLSNHFENKNESNRIGANFRVAQKKYNYQLGLSAQQITLVSNNLTKGTKLSQRYTNLFPNASFNYRFANSKSLRFNYRGRTNQPSISQLQNVLDVSNPPYYRIGNPALRQEFINNFSLVYNLFNMTKFRNLFAALTFSNTYN